MKWLIGFVCFIIGSLGVSGFAQSDSLFPQPFLQISLPIAADQMEVDPEGNILLLDVEKGLLLKYLATTHFDSSISVGGKSSRQEGFLRPIQLAQKNRQTLYVLDDALKRISLLNINFKVIQEMNFLDFESDLQQIGKDLRIYPIDFDINPAGEIFLLNDFDNSIIKINAFGEIEVTFAGLDYGEGSLYDPTQLQTSESRFVFVSDTSLQRLQVYDSFGVFRYAHQPSSSFRWGKFRLSQQKLFCFSPTQLYVEQLASGKVRQYHLPTGLRLLDLAVVGETIYLLWENEVHLYRFSP
jgi:hypothetical protein